MANNNRRDDSGSGERYLQQWHGIDHEETTSNLAVSLTAILLANGIRNNGMELVLTTQRPTSQNRSPP
jgi:hypothetical protein